MQTCKAEDYFTDVIAPPPPRKVHILFQFAYIEYKCNNFKSKFYWQTVSNRESEVQTEDEQSFLGKQQQLLQQAQNQSRGESPMRTPPPGKTVPRTSVCINWENINAKIQKSIFHNRLTLMHLIYLLSLCTGEIKYWYTSCRGGLSQFL